MAPSSVEQLARLLDREAQLVGADLGQRAGQSQPMQAERVLFAGAQHHPQLWPQPRQQECQPAQCLRRVQLVQVVDDEHTGRLQPPDCRQQPLDHRLTAEVGR
jgi:hypothetical protein